MKTLDLAKRFGAEEVRFGFTESVLIHAGMVICTPGGPNASLAALDRETGETIWQTQGLSQPSGYCSPRLIHHQGRDLILTMLANAVVAVEDKTGKVVWQKAFPHRYGVQPNPPLFHNGTVYVSSGMGTGGAMLALASDVSEAKWDDKTLDCQMQGTVLLDGYIYGTAQSGNRGLVCLDWNMGKVMWNAPVTKQGVVVAADGMLYVYTQDGIMYLVEPSPEAFKPVSQFVIPAGTDEHWAHPTIANGTLYVRHGDALLAYDLSR